MGRRARVAHEVSKHPARDLLLTAQLGVLGVDREPAAQRTGHATGQAREARVVVVLDGGRGGAGGAHDGPIALVGPRGSGAAGVRAAAVTGGRVRVDGLGTSSTQGDLNFVRVLEAMGATITIADGYTEVIGPPNGALRGVDLDLNAISDTAQTLAAIAPFADGPTTFRGVEHARLKETDRVAALATELRKLGQQVEERPDGLTIVPQPIVPADIDTYDDHRMAMSFGVATLRAPGIRILDPGCTAKTFPDYFQRLTALAVG